MLFSTNHHPKLYSPPTLTRCNSEIQLLLEDTTENFVILDDKNGTITNLLSELPKSQGGQWAKELIIRNRIVRLPFSFSDSDSTFSSIVNDAQPHGSFVSNDQDSRLLLIGSDIFLVENYIGSNFRNEFKSFKFNQWYPEGGLTVENFRENILRPICKYARKIHIIDKYVLSITAGVNTQENLNIILEVVNENSSFIEKIVLHTKTNYDKKQVGMRLRLIQLLQEMVATFTGLSGKIEYKMYDTSDGDFPPHDRFIITDQIGIQLGQGAVNLFDIDENWRDATISYINNPGSVLKELDALPIFVKSNL